VLFDKESENSSNLNKFFVTTAFDLIDAEKLTQLRLNFRRNGMTVVDWARQHNFPLPLVYAVMTGRSKAHRGQSYDIAVKLGLIERSDQISTH
jgi:gp16 family phage-associated protein